MTFRIDIKGNVTILLTLSLTIIIGVIFTILEAARLTVLKTYYTDVSYLSTDSLFGDYCYELFEEYGIFALNTSDVDIETSLSDYAKDNIYHTSPADIFNSNYNLLTGTLEELSVNNYIYLTDEDGSIFSDQILKYMKYKELSEITDIISNTYNTDSFNTYDFSADNSDINSFDLSALDTPVIEDRRECLEIDTKEAKSYTEDLSEYISHTIKNNLLLILVDDTSTISTTEIDKLILPSMTTTLSDEATVINEGYVKSSDFLSPEKIMFEEYISSTFNCYTNNNSSSLLRYELEYIINGSSKDDENLLNTAIKLIFMRASLNAAYIISDSSKRTAANDLATIATGGTPIATKFTEFMIISSWATAEGVIDVKDLLSGKKVPLIKDDNTWTLSLDGICNLSKNTISSNSGKEGFDYAFYLKLLLTAQSELALRFRTMDLIQMNICLNYNSSFRMSNCVCGLTTNFIYKAKTVFFNFTDFIGSYDYAQIDVSTTYKYD